VAVSVVRQSDDGKSIRYLASSHHSNSKYDGFRGAHVGRRYTDLGMEGHIFDFRDDGRRLIGYEPRYRDVYAVDWRHLVAAHRPAAVFVLRHSKEEQMTKFRWWRVVDGQAEPYEDTSAVRTEIDLDPRGWFGSLEGTILHGGVDRRRVAHPESLRNQGLAGDRQDGAGWHSHHNPHHHRATQMNDQD
jgi:hypothetical protein